MNERLSGVISFNVEHVKKSNVMLMEYLEIMFHSKPELSP